MSRKSEIRLIAQEFPEVFDKIRTEETAPEFSEGGIGFFSAASVPKPFRSRHYTRPKDGKVFKVCTIDDVIRWAQTEKGAKQIMAGRDPLQSTFDFIERALSEFSGDSAGGCNSNVGLCE